MEITNVGGNGTPSAGKVQTSEAADPAQTNQSSSSSQSTGSQVYQSPVVAFDSVTGDPVLQFRNSSSGVQEFQVPTRQALEYARREQQVEDKPKASTRTITV